MRLALEPKVAVVEEDKAVAEEDKAVAEGDTAVVEEDKVVVEEDQRMAVASNHRQSIYNNDYIKIRLSSRSRPT
jgi:hypothetical protein